MHILGLFLPQQTLTVNFQFLSCMVIFLFLKLSKDVCKGPVHKQHKGHLQGEAETAETPGLPVPVGRLRASEFPCSRAPMLAEPPVLGEFKNFCASRGNEFSNNMWPDL